MTLYHFRTDLRCMLANGEVAILRAFEVAVETYSREHARDCVEGIATEMVHDRGSELLDAPMDYLEVIKCDSMH